MNSQPETELREVAPLASISKSIVCGTDFSEASVQAVEVAAAFAKAAGEPLVLVHAANKQGQDNLPGELRESLALYARARYHSEQERLRALGVEAMEEFCVGVPSAVLSQQAVAHGARLIVMGAPGKRRSSEWLHGGVAEQVAEAVEAPSLIVRQAGPLLRWLKGQRRLRIVVGADLTAPSDAALRWVNELRSLAPCEVVAVFVDSSLTAYLGRDLNAATLMDEFVLEVTRQQERAFRRRVREVLGRTHVRVRCESGWSHSDAHLIELAAEERADLLVVGTHSRRGLSRLGHHSVSRGVLRYAPVNVACVPATAASPGHETSCDSVPTLHAKP